MTVNIMVNSAVGSRRLFGILVFVCTALLMHQQVQAVDECRNNMSVGITQQNQAKCVDSEQRSGATIAGKYKKVAKTGKLGKKSKLDAFTVRARSIRRTLVRGSSNLKKVLWGTGSWNQHYLRRLISLLSAGVGMAVAGDALKSAGKAYDHVQNNIALVPAGAGDENNQDEEEKGCEYYGGMNAWYDEQEEAQVNAQTYGEQLINLVREGDIGALEKALAENNDLVRYIDYSRSDGITALCIAIDLGLTDIARLLIDRGASLVYQRHQFYQDGPLFVAARKGNAEIMRIILQQKAMQSIDLGIKSWPQRGGGEESLLYAAVKGGSVEIVRALRDFGAVLTEQESARAWEYAIMKHRDINMLKETYVADSRRTSIMIYRAVDYDWAADGLHDILAEYVHGDALSKAITVEDALCLAIQKGKKEVAIKLLEHCDYASASQYQVWHAITNNVDACSVELAEVLLSKPGTDLSDKHWKGVLFNNVVEKDRFDVMQIFIDKYKEEVLRMVDDCGLTLLDKAVEKNARIVGRMLIRGGATMTGCYVGQYGKRLVVNEAIELKRFFPDMVATVLRYKKVDVTARDYENYNALMIALGNSRWQDDAEWSVLAYVGGYKDAEEAIGSVRWDKIDRRYEKESLLKRVFDGKSILNFYKGLNEDRSALRQCVEEFKRAQKKTEEEKSREKIQAALRDGIVSGLLRFWTWCDKSDDGELRYGQKGPMGIIVDYALPIDALELVPWPELRRTVGLEGETIDDEIALLIQERALKNEQKQKEGLVRASYNNQECSVS